MLDRSSGGSRREASIAESMSTFSTNAPSIRSCPVGAGRPRMRRPGEQMSLAGSGQSVRGGGPPVRPIRPHRPWAPRRRAREEPAPPGRPRQRRRDPPVRPRTRPVAIGSGGPSDRARARAGLADRRHRPPAAASGGRRCGLSRPVRRSASSSSLLSRRRPRASLESRYFDGRPVLLGDAAQEWAGLRDMVDRLASLAEVLPPVIGAKTSVHRRSATAGRRHQADRVQERARMLPTMPG